LEVIGLPRLLVQEADLRHFGMEKLACFDHVRALMTVDGDSLLGCHDFKPKVMEPEASCLDADLSWEPWLKSGLGKKAVIDPPTKISTCKIRTSFYSSILSHIYTLSPSPRSPTILHYVGNGLAEIREEFHHSQLHYSAIDAQFGHSSSPWQQHTQQHLSP
jgi:hypothetical protein